MIKYAHTYIYVMSCHVMSKRFEDVSVCVTLQHTTNWMHNQHSAHVREKQQQRGKVLVRTTTRELQRKRKDSLCCYIRRACTKNLLFCVSPYIQRFLLT